MKRRISQDFSSLFRLIDRATTDDCYPDRNDTFFLVLAVNQMQAHTSMNIYLPKLVIVRYPPRPYHVQEGGGSSVSPPLMRKMTRGGHTRKLRYEVRADGHLIFHILLLAQFWKIEHGETKSRSRGRRRQRR